MVIDTSALVAIVLDEEEAAVFEDLILRAPVAVMSVVSMVECAIALQSKRITYMPKRLDDTMATLRIDIRGVDLAHGEIARRAFAQYGRGQGLAQLNFGDCFSYALAKSREDTLLFKADDFLKTDIVAAWRP